MVFNTAGSDNDHFPDEVLTCTAARELFPFDMLISIFLISQRHPVPVVEALW